MTNASMKNIRMWTSCVKTTKRPKMIPRGDS